jgi:hypothetical protein
LCCLNQCIAHAAKSYGEGRRRCGDLTYKHMASGAHFGKIVIRVVA